MDSHSSDEFSLSVALYYIPSICYVLICRCHGIMPSDRANPWINHFFLSPSTYRCPSWWNKEKGRLSRRYHQPQITFFEIVIHMHFLIIINFSHALFYHPQPSDDMISMMTASAFICMQDSQHSCVFDDTDGDNYWIVFFWCYIYGICVEVNLVHVLWYFHFVFFNILVHSFSFLLWLNNSLSSQGSRPYKTTNS